MLIGPRELLDRRRYGARRADELARLRARFGLAIGVGRARAQAVLVAKRAVIAAMGDVRACAGCARGCAAPKGRFDGGRCCGTSTLEVFRPEEVRALAAAGREAPREATRQPGHAGCAFRASHGCVLDVDDRPVRCVQYACAELKTELEEAGRWPDVQRARRDLDEAFAAIRDSGR